MLSSFGFEGISWRISSVFIQSVPVRCIFCVCVCRMDSDYYQVPVGAASEGGRVLQTVSQSRLQLPAPGYSC